VWPLVTMTMAWYLAISTAAKMNKLVKLPGSFGLLVERTVCGHGPHFARQGIQVCLSVFNRSQRCMDCQLSGWVDSCESTAPVPFSRERSVSLIAGLTAAMRHSSPAGATSCCNRFVAISWDAPQWCWLTLPLTKTSAGIRLAEFWHTATPSPGLLHTDIAHFKLEPERTVAFHDLITNVVCFGLCRDPSGSPIQRHPVMSVPRYALATALLCDMMFGISNNQHLHLTPPECPILHRVKCPSVGHF